MFITSGISATSHTDQNCSDEWFAILVHFDWDSGARSIFLNAHSSLLAPRREQSFLSKINLEHDPIEYFLSLIATWLWITSMVEIGLKFPQRYHPYYSNFIKRYTNHWKHENYFSQYITYVTSLGRCLALTVFWDSQEIKFSVTTA